MKEIVAILTFTAKTLLLFSNVIYASFLQYVLKNNFIV